MNIFTLFAHSAFDNLVQASESSLYVKYFQFQNRNNFLKDGTIFQSLNVLPSCMQHEHTSPLTCKPTNRRQNPCNSESNNIIIKDPTGFSLE